MIAVIHNYTVKRKSTFVGFPHEQLLNPKGEQRIIAIYLSECVIHNKFGLNCDNLINYNQALIQTNFRSVRLTADIVANESSIFYLRLFINPLS